jgi:hypothetical protein
VGTRRGTREDRRAKSEYAQALFNIRAVYKELKDMGVVTQKVEETSDKIGFFRSLLNHIYLIDIESEEYHCGLCGRRFDIGEPVIRVRRPRTGREPLEFQTNDYLCANRRECRERLATSTNFLEWVKVTPYNREEE